MQRDLATEVDHIDGLGPLGPRGFDPSNWQAMSKAHHARKTARETWGT
ncbi:HNH endonuclease signature motif containing protein [Streptomyces sp. NPDC057235]